MEALNPYARPEDVLSRREMPGMGRNTAELELDTVLEHAGAGMGELTPRANREGEVRTAHEVVAGETVHGVSGAEDDEEILRVMPVNREVALRKLEGAVQHVGDVLRGHAGPGAGDDGHHGAGQHLLSLLHLNGTRHDDPHRLRGVRSGHQCSRSWRRRRWWRGLARRGPRGDGMVRSGRHHAGPADVGDTEACLAGAGVVAGDEAATAPDVVRAVADTVAVVEAAETQPSQLLRRGTALALRRRAGRRAAWTTAVLAARSLEAVRVDLGAARDAVYFRAGPEAGLGLLAMGRRGGSGFGTRGAGEIGRAHV